MGRQSKGVQKYQPRALTETHKEILRRLALGQRPKDIAEALGITTRVVSYVQHCELGRDYLDTLMGRRDEDAINISRELHSLAPHAVETLREGLLGRLGTSAPDHAKLKSAESVLDRAGYGRTTKHTVNESRFISIEHIRRLASETAENRGLRDMRLADVIDIEASEVSNEEQEGGDE